MYTILLYETWCNMKRNAYPYETSTRGQPYIHHKFADRGWGVGGFRGLVNLFVQRTILNDHDALQIVFERLSAETGRDGKALPRETSTKQNVHDAVPASTAKRENERKGGQWSE